MHALIILLLVHLHVGKPSHLLPRDIADEHLIPFVILIEENEFVFIENLLTLLI